MFDKGRHRAVVPHPMLLFFYNVATLTNYIFFTRRRQLDHAGTGVEIGIGSGSADRAAFDNDSFIMQADVLRDRRLYNVRIDALHHG